MDYNIKLISPKDLTENQISIIIELLDKGGESYMVDIYERIKNKTELFSLAYYGDQMIGVKALKYPTEEYIESIIKRCGCDPMDVVLEMGFAYIDTDYRGKGIYREMTKQLMDNVYNPICSITREENRKVINVLGSFGFKQKGEVYLSQDGTKDLVFLVKK